MRDDKPIVAYIRKVLPICFVLFNNRFINLNLIHNHLYELMISLQVFGKIGRHDRQPARPRHLTIT